MHIIFGFELDTGSYPDSLGDAEARQGMVVLGPAGLIGVLETQLGLSGVHIHQAVRIGQYLRRLRAADDGNCFYSQSLQKDSWSTAKQLLAWRDELVLSGWKGVLPQHSPRRLKELGTVENLREMELSPGLGDRLATIFSALETGKQLSIQLIELVEPLRFLPYIWNKLFSSLSLRGVKLTGIQGANHKVVSAQGSHDLTTLQQALVNKKPYTGAIQGDGSLCFFEGANEFEVSEALASWLEVFSGDPTKLLFVRGDGSPVLDDVLHSHNLPGLGGESRSRWRTALQVLPLVLTFSWEPLDPQRLLEMLTLPKSPIPSWAARHFEQALREHPGINGPKWQEAWEAIRSDYDDRANAIDNGAQPRKSFEEFRQDLQFWLGEHRYDPEQGMPASFIQDTCSRVAKWASSRGGLENDQLLIASAAIAAEVSKAVAATGLERISRPQLDRILDSVVGEGLENPDYLPEAASWSQVTTPGQIWGRAETIIWWNFTAADLEQRRLPWTRAEIAALDSVGVNLENIRQTRLRQARSWRNPALRASKQLILCAPLTLANEKVVPHPFWDEIRYFLSLKGEDIQRLSFTCGDLWRTSEANILGEMVKRQPQSVTPPPMPQREWRLPTLELPLRDRESATSMQQLIQCPLSWIFKYILKLYPGDLIDLPETSMVMGNLAHTIIPEIISQSDLPDPKIIQEQAMLLFDEYLPMMAASLAHPGRELERLRYRTLIGKAARILCQHLRSANLKVIGFETVKERIFREGQTFAGRVDLLLATEHDQPFILDLKWSRWARYKRDELREGKALQLAAYSWLLEPESGCYPPGGYYLVAQGELVVSACQFLPDPCVFPDIDLQVVWQQGLKAYHQRLQELQDGIALAAGVASGNSGDERKQTDVMELKPSCTWCDYINLCGAPR